MKFELEGEAYSAVDIVFTFAADLPYRATGYTDDSNLISVNTRHLDIVNYLILKLYDLIGLRGSSCKSIERIEKMKGVEKDNFGNLDAINPCTLKFHMLDHIAKRKEIWAYELL